MLSRFLTSVTRSFPVVLIFDIYVIEIVMSHVSYPGTGIFEIFVSLNIARL